MTGDVPTCYRCGKHPATNRIRTLDPYTGEMPYIHLCDECAKEYLLKEADE